MSGKSKLSGHVAPLFFQAADLLSIDWNRENRSGLPAAGSIQFDWIGDPDNENYEAWR
jgi:hypothetical protein